MSDDRRKVVKVLYPGDVTVDDGSCSEPDFMLTIFSSDTATSLPQSKLYARRLLGEAVVSVVDGFCVAHPRDDTIGAGE